MNAAALIDLLSRIADHPDFTRASFLAELNKSQLAIAERVCLPALSDGLETVTTVVGAMYAALPATYHKKIFMAKNTSTGSAIEIFQNIGILAQRKMVYPGIDNEGDVVALTIQAGNILYQRVPPVAQTISLMFYRLPVAMTDSSTSYPDGLSGVRVAHQEVFDTAIIHHSAWKIAKLVEDGEEGQMPNVLYHKKTFGDAMVELSNICTQEEVQVYPLNTRCW